MSIFNWSRDTVMSAACGCSRGLKRPRNEDNFYFDGKWLDSKNDGLDEILTMQYTLTDKITDPGKFIAVFDGMGGGEYGEIASNVASVAADKYLADPDGIFKYDVSPSLAEMCRVMNEKVFDTGADLGASQMGSTLASLYFFGGYVWCCNVGDSKCFILRNGRLSKVSVDHNDAEEMKVYGITGRKPYITQYLGLDSREVRISPSISSYEVQAGDVYLICSDGLTDMVSEEKIVELIGSGSDPAGAVKTLIEEAEKNGGRDNITVIVCSMREK